MKPFKVCSSSEEHVSILDWGFGCDPDVDVHVVKWAEARSEADHCVLKRLVQAQYSLRSIIYEQQPAIAEGEYYCNDVYVSQCREGLRCHAVTGRLACPYITGQCRTPKFPEHLKSGLRQISRSSLYRKSRQISPSSTVIPLPSDIPRHKRAYLHL